MLCNSTWNYFGWIENVYTVSGEGRKQNGDAYTDSNLVRFPIPGDKTPDKLWLGSPLFVNKIKKKERNPK